MKASTYTLGSNEKIRICAAFYRLNETEDESEQGLSFCRYQTEKIIEQLIRHMPEHEQFHMWKALHQEAKERSYGLGAEEAKAITAPFWNL